ncbi:MAG: hypothetical protein R3B72_15080 [Polyangiaceae bacterium]
MTKGLGLIGLGLGGLLAGCGGAPPPSRFPTANDALGRMKATYACANGVQGQGKIDHVSAEGRVRGNVLLFAINPARVRVDVESSFGGMIFSLTSNGRDFKMLDTQNKQFLHGPAKACNLARMTQVPLPGHVLVSLLRGEAPLLVHAPEAPSLAWADGHYEVTIPSKHEARELVHLEVYGDDWAKPWGEQRLRVTHVEVSQRDFVHYRARLSDHAVAHTAPPREDEDGIDPPIPPSGGPCDVEIPKTIEMVVPLSGDDVAFRYQNVEFNPPIPAGAFTQPTPGGVREVFVDCPDE